MIPLDIGDPGSYALPSNPNFFPTNLPGGLGRLVVQNDSPYSINIMTGDGGPYRVPSGWARLISIVNVPTPTATWAVVSSISPANSLLSDLFIEAYGLDEDVPETYPAQIIRQVAVGNQVATTNQNLVVASTLGVSVTDNLLHTVLSYTTVGTSNDYMRLSVALFMNSSGTPKPALTLSYTDAAGTARTLHLLGTTLPGTNVLARFDGSSTIGPQVVGGDWPTVFDTIIRAKSGTALSLTLQDTSATLVNYNVSAALEQLIQN